MERISINIETGGAAFEDAPTAEIARILRRIAEEFEHYGEPVRALRDLNGNTCGSVQVQRAEVAA